MLQTQVYLLSAKKSIDFLFNFEENGVSCIFGRYNIAKKMSCVSWKQTFNQRDWSELFLMSSSVSLLFNYKFS